MFLQLVYVLLFVFEFIPCDANPYCGIPCEYGNEEIVHTVCERGEESCRPATRCGPDFKIIRLTDRQRQRILDLHNSLRCKVSLGKETRGQQPPAANMKIMSYDKELEFIAQCWANACNGIPLEHDKCRRTAKFRHVGQNLGFVNSTANNIKIDKAMHQLTKYWYDEVAIFNNEWIFDTQDRGPYVKVGHYTQMLWANTDKLGCAAVHFVTKNEDNSKMYQFLFVCNYGPGGNYLGQPVYQPGVPCSACPDKLKCNNLCKGMCGTFVNVTNTKHESYLPLFKL